MTATSKHTPPLGPWFNTTEDDSPFGEVMDQPLDSGVTLHVSISGERAKEAACLIAAAPDLLEALREMHAALQIVLAGKAGQPYANLETRTGRFVSMAPLMQQTEAALAKATGSPS